MNRQRIVLLVEDNPAHAELVKRQVLQDAPGTEVILAADGDSAISCLLDSPPEVLKRIALVLLDLRLPKIDGLEVLRLIKQHEKLYHIPVVILSTSSAEDDLTDAYQNFVNGYLVKPVDFGDFRQMISAVINFWLVWNVEAT